MTRTHLGVAVLVIGAIALAVIVWIRATGKPATQTPLPPPKNIPVEFRASSYKYDLVPERLGANAVAEAVGNKIADQARNTFDDPTLTQKLGEAVAGRLALLLQPEFDQWHAEASRFTTPPDPDTVIDKASGMTFREQWEAGAIGFDRSPIASEGVVLRHISPDEEFLLDTGIPGAFLRATFGITSAEYPKPPPNDPAVHTVEVLFPVKYRSVGSRGHDQPAMAALRLFWNVREGHWQPYDFVLYMDGSALGKTLPFPYL